MTDTRRTLLLALALALPAAAARAEPRPDAITIATEGAYEPWNFVRPDGKLAGFEVDLAADLCGRMKVRCTVVAQDWDGLIPALDARKFDAIMASLIVTAKRQAVIDFSQPYAPTAAAFMVDGAGPLAKLPGTGTTVDLGEDAAKLDADLAPLRAALKGKAVGVQVSTANANFVNQYLKGVVDEREYKTVEQHDLDLQAGRVDAVMAQKTSLNAALEKADFKGYALSGPTFVNGVFGQGVAVGLRKGDATLKGMFDAAITAAKADGTIDRLAKTWFKTGFN